MKKKELLKQLNNLKETIKPDSSWQEANRDILLSQINAQTRLDFEKTKLQLFSKVFSRNFIMPILKPVASLVLIIVFVFGVWTASVNATKKSLPGDLFYNIKLTSERVQVNLALNNEKKANLEIAFAERRLEEIEKLVKKTEQEENLQIPLKKFQENMNNVQSNLAKLEIKDKETAIKIANLIDEKSKEYVGLLMDQQEQNPSLALNTEEAISASKSTANKALSIIIEEYETGDSDLSAEEVVSKVQSRIDSLQTALNSAKIDIDTIIKAQSAEAIRLAEEAARLAEEEAARLAAEEAAAEEEVSADQSTEEILDEETPIAENPAEDSEQEGEAVDQSASESEEPIQDQPADQLAEKTPVDEPPAQETPAEIINEEPVEPVEVLPTIEEIKDMRIEALALLVDAENLLKENQVNQAFDKVKQADDLLSLINKVILANSQYLPVEGESDQDSQTEAEADSQADNPELKNSAAQISGE